MSWYDQAIASWYRNQDQGNQILAQGINSLGTSIGKAIEEGRQNQVANQIATQNNMGPVTAAANSGAYAPRAALVDPGAMPGTDDTNVIDPGVSTAGTAPARAPFTGGLSGLQLQIAIDAAKRQSAGLGSEIALRQAQAGYYGAHADTIQQQLGINQQRADAYQQGVNQRAQAQPQVTIQGFTKQAQDLLGKDKAQPWLDSITGGTQLQRGNVVNVPESPGAPAKKAWYPDPGGDSYSFGDNDDDLIANAQPAKKIDTLKAQYSKVGAGNQPAARENQALQTVGTFTGPNGNKYPVFPDSQTAGPGGHFLGTDGKTVFQNP